MLPHCTAATTGEICLITPDLKKGKKIDHEPTIDHWKDILQEAGVTEVCLWHCYYDPVSLFLYENITVNFICL